MIDKDFRPRSQRANGEFLIVTCSNNIDTPVSLFMLIDNPPPFAGGGAGKHAYKLAKTLNRMRHKVKIVCPHCRAWKSRLKEYAGIPTQEIAVPASNFNFMFSLIYNVRLAGHLIAKCRDYKILHIQGIRGIMAVVLMAKLLRKKIFVTVLSSNYWRSLSADRSAVLLKTLRLTILGNVDQFIVLNRSLERLLLNEHIPPEKISLIPNGTEIIPLVTDKTLMRPRLGLAENHIIVLFAGRFHRQKDIPFLIRAWKVLNGHKNNTRLILLGDGPEFSSTQRLIDDLGLGQTAELRGFIPNVVDYMSAADIFVLPSRSEGCSNALLEAMSHGLACIATNSNGNDEVIENGMNGCLVEFGNEIELAGCIQLLLGDHERRQRLGLAARRTIHDKHSIEKIAEAHIQLYILRQNTTFLSANKYETKF